MEIVYTYTKKRSEYGRQPNFKDGEATVVANFIPDESKAEAHFERDPCVTVAQVHPDVTDSAVNTSPTVSVARGMSHTEGGWPQEIDPEMPEHVHRYRKKKERSEEFQENVERLGNQLEDLIKQNNAIDIYEDYFSGVVVDHSSEPPSSKVLTILKDPHQQECRRQASYVSWYPDGARKLAVAYSILDFQQQPEDMPLSSYIWDLSKPTIPDFEVMTVSQLCSLKYSPKDPNIILGGQFNGQVAYWDTRKGHHAIEVSLVENSHKDPVWDVAWLRSKTGAECLSVSTDGYALFWNIRRLGEPIQRVLLKDKSGGNVHGATTLNYDPQAGPSKFTVGTETGNALACNKGAKNPADIVGNLFPGHHAPVYGLERHPFFSKYFMTIGDWTSRIWIDDLKTPIITTKYYNVGLSTGKWSPTRPGVFYTARSDGVLDVWDMFYKQNDPVLSINVSTSPLSSLQVQQQGRLLACGSKDGNVSIVEVSDGLAEIQSNEKQSINQLLERETKRERNLDQLEKEARMKARKEAKKQTEEPEKNDEMEEKLRTLEVEFFELTRKTDEDEDGDLLSSIETGDGDE